MTQAGCLHDSSRTYINKKMATLTHTLQRTITLTNRKEWKMGVERPPILFISPYELGARGNVTTTRRIVEGYRERGYSVKVFSYEQGGA